MTMREGVAVGNPWRDAAGTQRRRPDKRGTSPGRYRGRKDMKTKNTDIPIGARRARGIGEVIRTRKERMTGRRKGKETSW